MEQQTGSKWEKEYVKAVYCHPAYLTYMHTNIYAHIWGFPGGASGKEPACQCR